MTAISPRPSMAPRPEIEHSTVGHLMTLMPTGADTPRDPRPHLFEARGQLDAYVLTELIYDVRRRRPLVVLTSRRPNGIPYDIVTLAADLWPVADVVPIYDAETTQALCANLPSWLHVYNGATRILRPGIDVSDLRDRHPLILAPRWHNVEDAALANILREARAGGHGHSHDPVVALEQLRQDHENLQTELGKLRRDLAEARSAARQDKDPKDPAEPVVFTDPIEQLDHEIWLAWLRSTPEPDRERWLRRTYDLGPEFLDSITETKDLISRTRVIRCCVDVITGRYAELPGRLAKRSKPRGGSEITRADGAVAWRCAVGAELPGAPRMLWWECPGNTVEFSRVAHHDDFRVA